MINMTKEIKGKKEISGCKIDQLCVVGNLEKISGNSVKCRLFDEIPSSRKLNDFDF